MELDQLKKHLIGRLNRPNPDNLEVVISKFSLAQYKKGDTLLYANDICKKILFVCSGCIQVTYSDTQGRVWTREIVCQDQWCCDLDSFLHEQASTEEMHCLQPTTVLGINKQNFLLLQAQVPGFGLVYQQILSELYIETNRRIQFMLTQDAKARIAWFYRQRPDLVKMLTAKTIASYLHLHQDVYGRLRPQVLRENF